MNATPKTVKYVSDLVAQRLTGNARENAERIIAEGIAQDRASRWITRLEGLPKIAAPKADEEIAGMYRDGEGTILRCYLGQQSGRMLVKALREQDGEYRYEYLGAATRFLRGAERLPLAEAKEFGRMSGTCCVCARRLDNPESVDAGIGPVCASRV